MTELNCVLVFQEKVGTITAYYPYTKWRNILDAPNVGAMESDLYGHIGNTDVHVTAAQINNYDTTIAGLIEHTENTEIHITAAERAAWTAGAQKADKAAADASSALNLAASLESRVARVEDGIFNNITGNPFLVSFDALDGVTLVKGVWNVERQRIEC